MTDSISKKVVVGLSGGVDSAVAAHLLKKQGYEVHGLLLRVPFAHCPEKDAKAVAKHLEIPLVVIDVAESFKNNVIDYFCKAYENGTTPNPCVICNPMIKFAALRDYALKIGAENIATGHYAGVLQEGEHVFLRRDLQSEKDQSYMLHRLSKDILAITLFPLFKLDKNLVRKIAADSGIPVASKRDSQEICFIPQNDYLAFLEQQGLSFVKGNFVSLGGEPLGTHRGIGAYTIGQRKGLGIISPSPLYVNKIDKAANTVVLSSEDALYRTKIICNHVHLSAPLRGETEASIKIRLSKKEESGILRQLPDGLVEVLFNSPVRAPSPGQFAVFYHGEKVLGGGCIVE